MFTPKITFSLDTAKTMAALLKLSKVREALAFLHQMGIVQKDAIAKGYKKFLVDHPEIQKCLNSL